MPRHRDINWNLPEGVKNATGGKTHRSPNVHSALLMDIRDELKTLNRLLSCPNFLRMPMKLEAMRKLLSRIEHNHKQT